MKAYLDELVIKYNTPEFIENDPVQFPHRYSEKKDIEIVSFLIATISWGKRSMILYQVLSIFLPPNQRRHKNFLLLQQNVSLHYQLVLAGGHSCFLLL